MSRFGDLLGGKKAAPAPASPAPAPEPVVEPVVEEAPAPEPLAPPAPYKSERKTLRRGSSK